MLHSKARPRACKIVIAEDDRQIRSALCGIAGQHCEVVGEAENGKQAVGLADELHPNIVLLDVSMPLMNGFEAARIIRNKLPEIKIIIVSGHFDQAYIEKAFEIGVHGYVFKNSVVADLPQALERVSENLTYYSH